MNKISSLLFIGLALLSIGIVMAHEGNDDYVHHGMMSSFYGGHGYGFMWIFGWIFMLLVFIALILFIVWLIKQIQEPVRKSYNGE
jgi:uncharacterized membrane protein